MRGLQQNRLGVRLELRSRRKRQNRGQKHRHTDEAQAVRRDVRPEHVAPAQVHRFWLWAAGLKGGVEPGIRSGLRLIGVFVLILP